MDIRKANITELLLLAIKKRRRFEVTGNSMLPLLKPGDQVLIKKGQPSVGDIVVCQHPTKNLNIIKKVVSISENQITVEGLNKEESTDSDSFGKIETNKLAGLVTSLI